LQQEGYAVRRRIQNQKKNAFSGQKGTHKPVSNPPGKGVHGSAKLDWVTLWFFGWKVNSTVSPTAAVWKRRNVSATVKYNGWLPDDVGRIKDETCSIVANIDLISYRGGCRREQSDSAKQYERRYHRSSSKKKTRRAKEGRVKVVKTSLSKPQTRSFYT
jgi:hypothetical protein